jgi:hypothetical protein
MFLRLPNPRRTDMRQATRTIVIGMALVAIAGSGGSSRKAPEPVGTGSYFFCAMGQTVKYFGLFTGNVGLTVAGAIGGSIACGMGW